jgi:hypothetical protein
VRSFAFLSLAASLIAAPRDIAPSFKIPARFEPASNNHFTGRGFRYGVSVGAAGYRLNLGSRLLDVSFKGATATAPGSGDSPFRFKTARYRGAQKRETPSYARVRFSNSLPGVDVVYRETLSHLEFDFVVKPGADPRQVALHYDGHDSLQHDSEGNLVLTAAGERIVQQIPVVYQKLGNNTRLISGAYEVLGPRDVAFVLGPYDRSRPLVIDPVILYSGFINGNARENAVAITRDAQGFLYVAGTTGSTDLPVVSAKQANRAADLDLFIAKINPFAPSPDDIVYLTYLGGAGADEVKAMTMPSPGILHLTGSTTSADFPVTSNAYKSTTGGDRDAFFIIANLTPESGEALQYSTFFGGSGAESGNAIITNAEGNTYIAGYSASGDLPFGGEPVQSANRGGWDAFLAIFTPSGSLLYSTELGGDKTDIATAVALDTDGFPIIAGTTASPDFPLAGASYDTVYHGGGDLFLAKIIPFRGLDGLVYATYFGGSGADQLRQMDRDSAGRLVLRGYTRSMDFPATQSSAQPSIRGESDLFVTVLDLSQPQGAALRYSTYLGGGDADILFGSKLDGTSLLLTGYTFSKDYPVTVSALQNINAGAPDMFVTRLDYSKPGSAALTYSTYLGGSLADTAYAVESDTSGYLYVVGNTNSRRFPVSANERPASPGDTSAVVIAVQACGVTLSSSGTDVPGNGGSATFLVTAAPDCSWTAQSLVPWLTVTTGANGSGNGSVTLTAASNDTGSARSGAIAVNDQRYQVTQAPLP